MRRRVLSVADPEQAVAAIEIAAQLVERVIGLATVADDDEIMIFERVREQGLQLFGVISCLLLGVQHDQTRPLTMQMDDGAFPHETELGWWVDGEIIGCRIVPRDAAGARQNTIEVESQHAGNEVVFHQCRHSDRCPVDFGILKIGVEQAAANLLCQLRHAYLVT